MAFSKLLHDDSFDLLMSQADVSDLLDADIDLPNFSLGLEVNTENNIPKVDNNKTADLTDNEQQNQRFVNLLDSELDDIARANSERTTAYQTRWALKLFRGKYTYFSHTKSTTCFYWFHKKQHVKPVKRSFALN